MLMKEAALIQSAATAMPLYMAGIRRPACRFFVAPGDICDTGSYGGGGVADI